ncbi:armadillo repeat-containing protein gudu-like [Harmonia axyridis]|uniref:armadillo repeat-containing protein gudu-like n=1 Tax=Harmonia axyridis TaxID=115357 RepID=UPI001E2755BD|nr:armadillo repeat-containing protein gudu-like [Harmonia axyridis]
MSKDLTESTTSIDNLKPREVFVGEETDSEESSGSSGSTDDEVERERPKFECPPEYWHIQKLMKYLKTGNQTATVVALCCLKDHDLKEEVNQFAIQDMGGLEVLINLLETTDIKAIKLGALSILGELSQSENLRKAIVDLGAVPQLVKNLVDPAGDVRVLIGENIFHLARLKKARKDLRHWGGLPLLVDLLDVPEKLLQTSKNDLNPEDLEMLLIAESSAKGLWSASKSKKNMMVMMKTGAVPLLSKLIASVHIDVIKAAMGTLSQCVVEPGFQLAVQTEGMVKNIVKHLINEDDIELKTHCCDTIYYCGEDPITRNMVREAGGLDILVKIINDANNRKVKPLMAAATGAVWKTAMSPENVERFDSLRAVEILIKLLEDVDEDERVLANVVGALGQFVKLPKNRDVVRRIGGIPLMINLLNYTYLPLLENLAMVLKECAEDEDSMAVIEDNDGVRLIWSLLKNPAETVQANAAWCLVPCIRNVTNSGEMVRSFVGGLELMVRLLENESPEVLSCVCAAIAEIATDIENLAVISDHGVVPLLVDLVKTGNPQLRQHLAAAIGKCCAWGINCKLFGRLGAITPLVNFMAEGTPEVQRTTAMALHALSTNQFNCITMHESGVVRFLLSAVGSKDQILQEAAAGCLANIRKLALDAETKHLIKKKEEVETDEEN